MKKIILLSIISSGYLMPSSIVNKVADTSGQRTSTHAIKNLRGSVIEKKAMSYIDYLTTGKGQDFNFADPKLEGFTPEDVKLLQQFVDEFFIKNVVNVQGKNQLADQNYLELAVPLPAWLADRYENITDKILSDRFIQEFEFLGPQNIRRGIIEYIYQNNSQHNKGHGVFFYGKKNADYAADIVKIQRAIATMVNHFSTYVRFMGNILDVSFDEDTNAPIPLVKYVPVDEDVKYIIVPAQHILRLLDIMKKYQEDRQNITFIIAFDDNDAEIPDLFGDYHKESQPLNFIKNIVVAGISLKSIGKLFFAQCTELKSVVVPQGITQIKNGFLTKCTGLIRVQLPQRLTQVGDGFLALCSRLTQVQLPQGLTQAGEKFLAYCDGLTHLELPQGITQVGDNFLSKCSGLTRLELPQGITQVGNNFLCDCDKLTQVQLPQGLTQVGDYFLASCSSLTQVQLPHGLTQVGDAFLGGCSELTQVQLPQGLTHVGDYFLRGCSALKSLILPQRLTRVGNFFLGDCSRLTQLQLPHGLTQVGDAFLYNCSGLTQVQLPQGLTQVGHDFLRKCDKLTQLQLPHGLTHVGNAFLAKCVGLTQLRLPQALTRVGNYFLADCIGLIKLELPQGLIQVGGSFLRGCSALKSLILPQRLTWVGDKFLKDTSLRKLFATQSVFNIPSVQNFIAENQNVQIVLIDLSFEKFQEIILNQNRWGDLLKNLPDWQDKNRILLTDEISKEQLDNLYKEFIKISPEPKNIEFKKQLTQILLNEYDI